MSRDRRICTSRASTSIRPSAATVVGGPVAGDAYRDQAERRVGVDGPAVDDYQRPGRATTPRVRTLSALTNRRPSASFRSLVWSHEPDPDDDALRWEGDDDPTLAPGWKVVGKPVDRSTPRPTARMPRHPCDAARRRSDGADSVATPAAEVDGTTAVDGDADASRQAGSAELVILGVLGGVYLLYAIGWLIWAITPAPELADPVAQFMYGLGRWLAVAAPALWFGTVLWLAAEHRRARLALAHRGRRAPRAHSVPAARLR